MHVAQSYELVTIYESLNIVRPTNQSLGRGGVVLYHVFTGQNLLLYLSHASTFKANLSFLIVQQVAFSYIV